MNKEEMIDKMADAINKIKEETNWGVIKDYTINIVANLETGNETELAAVLNCGTKFEYTEKVLKHWKEQLGADEFRVKVNGTRLYITFVVYFKEE